MGHEKFKNRRPARGLPLNNSNNDNENNNNNWNHIIPLYCYYWYNNHIYIVYSNNIGNTKNDNGNNNNGNTNNNFGNIFNNANNNCGNPR